MTSEHENKVKPKESVKKSYLRNLEVSLKLRPDIFRLIIKLRQRVRQKHNTIVRLKKYLQKLKKKLSKNKDNESKEEGKTTQDTIQNDAKTDTTVTKETAAWNSTESNEKSIAEQVAEAAQSVVDQLGMVYVDSVGMYYDYKTGYYYNPNIGLYYHTSTNCYYTYDEQRKNFVFHSYPDPSKMTREQIAHKAYQKNLAKKHKKEKEENDEESKAKPKKRKHNVKSVVTVIDETKSNPKKEDKSDTEMEDPKKDVEDDKKDIELEDGECSDTTEESTDIEAIVTESEDEDNDDFVSKHHPPCMRIIVKETNISKLKVGSLFVITKDGGTVGREGETHTFLLKDLNVSKVHLSFDYDSEKKSYVVTDLGSRNGTLLNGHRMSEAQTMSSVMVIPHGSILQVAGTKLLCHIHSGNDTCGHCEPGLIMEAESKEKQTAYTRTCNVQVQHQLELARLKNKYAPQPLAIEETEYNDRAKARRETVGSTHNSEKTQQSDLNTEIDSENKGFKLLSKMGWSKGEGLGKEKQGETEPIRLINNESKAGLGAAGSASPVAVPVAGRLPLRLTTKSTRLKKPAKAFRDPLEEDD